MRIQSLLGVFTTLIAAAAFAATPACSSESALGEACDEIGKTEDVCESGGVCGKNTSGAVMCLKLCTDHAGCAADEECNGVEGTNLKGCRLKTSGGGTGTGTGAGDGTGDGDGGKK
jgi:hypothetical protein